jgi:hypothetical protein
MRKTIATMMIATAHHIGQSSRVVDSRGSEFSVGIPQFYRRRLSD